jgi:hypothetical protein
MVAAITGVVRTPVPGTQMWKWDSITPGLFSSSRLAPKVMLWANKVTGNTQIDSETQRFQRSRSTPQERFCEPVSVSYRTGLRHA